MDIKDTINADASEDKMIGALGQTHGRSIEDEIESLYKWWGLNWFVKWKYVEY